MANFPQDVLAVDIYTGQMTTRDTGLKTAICWLT